MVSVRLEGFYLKGPLFRFFSVVRIHVPRRATVCGDYVVQIVHAEITRVSHQHVLSLRGVLLPIPLLHIGHVFIRS